MLIGPNKRVAKVGGGGGPDPVSDTNLEKLLFHI